MTRKMKVVKNVVFVVLLMALIASGQLYVRSDGYIICFTVYIIAIVDLNIHCLLKDKINELENGVVRVSSK